MSVRVRRATDASDATLAPLPPPAAPALAVTADDAVCLVYLLLGQGKQGR